ncbi:MAG: ABC transporter permease [Clostridiaceae bacterium]|nr:ABC transporter permease [Clostridiaceae bacterium]
MQIIKREGTSTKQIIMIRLIAIIAAIIVSGIFIVFLGYNPVKVYVNMISGALGSKIRFRATLLEMVPLVITSLGILVAFKMKFWNIGGEGQILMGAFGATYIALFVDWIPKPLVIPVMFIVGFLAGGIWGIIPAFFKANFGANETIMTLMLNYIATQWITYLQYGPWRDPDLKGFAKIANFPDHALLPKVFGIHIGLIISLVLVIIISWFLRRTKRGFEISVVGESVSTARYAGMDISRIIITTMLLSGGLCGITGVIQAAGVNKTLTMNVSSGYGFTAVITTYLSGLRAQRVLIVSFLFAILLQGGSYIQSALQIPQAAADVLQGMILFCALGSEFFVNYKVRFRKNSISSEVK